MGTPLQRRDRACSSEACSPDLGHRRLATRRRVPLSACTIPCTGHPLPWQEKVLLLQSVQHLLNAHLLFFPVRLLLQQRRATDRLEGTERDTQERGFQWLDKKRRSGGGGGGGGVEGG